jgi:phage/plasmid-associated DNA primase
LTGGDIVQGRALWEGTTEFLPQFSIVLQMNARPLLSGFDAAVARRLKFIPFNNKFVDVVDAKKPLERLKDTGLRKRFETTEYAQQYMLLLLEYFHKNVHGNKKFAIPMDVEKYTNDYLGDEDVVKNFIDTLCVQTDDKKDRVSSKDLYDAFRSSDFYRANINKNVFPDHLFRIDLQKVKSNGTMMWIKLRLLPPVEDENNQYDM